MMTAYAHSLPERRESKVLTTVVPTHRRCVVNIQRCVPYSHIELGLLLPSFPFTFGFFFHSCLSRLTLTLALALAATCLISCSIRCVWTCGGDDMHSQPVWSSPRGLARHGA